MQNGDAGPAAETIIESKRRVSLFVDDVPETAGFIERKNHRDAIDAGGKVQTPRGAVRIL